MKKEPIMHKLFNFIDRKVEVEDFVNTGHLNMTEMPIPHIKDSPKHGSVSDEYKYL